MNNQTKNADTRPENSAAKGSAAKDLGSKNTGSSNTGSTNTGAKSQPQQNEGEGNRTAAREFNADQQRFAGDKQKVDQAAQAAKKAVDGPEGKDLDRAEKAGAKHAKG